MKKITLGIIATIVASASVSSSFACRCMEPKSPLESLKNAQSVFVGKVQNIKTLNNENLIEFKVYDNFKGTFTTTKTVGTATDGAACGVYFEKDKEYIVYTSQDEKNNERTSLCSRTKLLENAKTDLEVLGKEKNKYYSQKVFEMAKGNVCESATDGCNQLGLTDGKIMLSTKMYCGPEHQNIYSCTKGKDIQQTYNNKEDFEKSEGNTCSAATDGCNNYMMQDGKVFAGTKMYCEDIYGKNGQEKWSCTLPKITTKEEFLKKHGKTCKTATDGLNTFFGENLSASTMMGYPENFVADWKCMDEDNSHKICTREYMPVCGIDGKTYGNKCTAGSVKIAYEGECTPLSEKQKEKVENILFGFLQKISHYSYKTKNMILEGLIDKIEYNKESYILKNDNLSSQKVSLLNYLKVKTMEILDNFSVKNSQNVKKCDGTNPLEQCKK